MTSLEFRDRLARRARRAKAPLTLAMLGPLEAYFRLLAQWNAKINLTALPLEAPTDETFDRLLVEPLAAAPHLAGRARTRPGAPSGTGGRGVTPGAAATSEDRGVRPGSAPATGDRGVRPGSAPATGDRGVRPRSDPTIWFDLGSGGGSPAIPLLIAQPSLKLTMVESKSRKAAFLREAVRVLGLPDAAVVEDRFENVGRSELANTADFVTVRAVKADGALFHAAGQLLMDTGYLLLFRPSHDPSPDPPGFALESTIRLTDAPQAFLCSYRRVFHVEQRR